MEQVPHRKHRIPYLESYEVLEEELMLIERGSFSRQYDQMALSIAVAVFLSFFSIHLGTQNAPAWVMFMVIVSGAAILYIGGRLWCARRIEIPVFQRIRARAVGPMGEEGKEIRATELQAMPPSSDTEQDR